jgi:hypothetical protein
VLETLESVAATELHIFVSGVVGVRIKQDEAVYATADGGHF